jgi:hypothetical protein
MRWSRQAAIFGAMALAGVLQAPPGAQARRRYVEPPTRHMRLGPWIEEGWRREDWSRAPAVRGWASSAPYDYDPVLGFPMSGQFYPWGYTTPFVRVGSKCVASELNGNAGGAVARYQRVMPAYYCN